MSINFNYKGKLSVPSDKDNYLKNVIHLNNTDYFVIKPPKRNKGGNSWILYLYDIYEYQDADEGEMPDPVYVMKVNKYSILKNDSFCQKRNDRFKEEIKALHDCSDAPYVITIVEDGTINDNEDSYLFYIMEAAKDDLKSYLEKRNNVKRIERLSICIKLVQAIDNLFKKGYYHRDIKPDNFFLTYEDNWKVGDLGLTANRNNGSSLDGEQEFIGPRGWTTPETMNKHLTKENDGRYDRLIDEKSDIFQLGMVIWYVIQGNAPIGCIKKDDFHDPDSDLYSLIRGMVSHNKVLRPSDFGIILERLNFIANKELI